MVTEGIEPSTVALLAQRSNQLSYATCLTCPFSIITNLTALALFLMDYYIRSSTRAVLPRFGLQELLIEGLRDIDFAIQCCHFLLVLDQFLLVDLIDILVNVLQFLELLLQVLEGKGLLLESAL